MKKKLFGILLIGIMIGLTGCDNNSKSNEQVKKSNYVMTCTNIEKADNEMEPTTKNKEVFEYNDKKILKNYTRIAEIEYSTEEETTKRKGMEQNSVERANTYEGVKASIETVSSTKYIVTYKYDIDVVDLDTVFNTHDEIDSNHKFSVDKYKTKYEIFHKNRNGKCIINNN